jgi:hypothetical protein
MRIWFCKWDLVDTPISSRVRMLGASKSSTHDPILGWAYRAEIVWEWAGKEKDKKQTGKGRICRSPWSSVWARQSQKYKGTAVAAKNIMKNMRNGAETASLVVNYSSDVGYITGMTGFDRKIARSQCLLSKQTIPAPSPLSSCTCFGFSLSTRKCLSEVYL